jgi:RHS repeat-associated protein
MRTRGRTLIALVMLILTGAGRTLAQGPTITSISPGSGPVGSSVLIAGTNFSASQGGSTISLNGASASVVSWSSTNILAVVPSGATSGPFSITVNGQVANSSSYTVTTLPSGWSDSDIGSVGVAGSANYANGTLTVKGAGADIYGTADAFQFAFQSLSGDGSIVARVVSLGNGGTYAKAGVMIRETLNNAGSTNAYMAYQANGSAIFQVRTSTGASTGQATASMSLPYWTKVVRSGNSFSGYISVDGATWVQVGTTQTISMAQTVYIGLATSNNNNSALDTATFDGVSISSSATSVPSIATISATTGSVGTQIGITGSNFGASEGNALVMIGGVPLTTVAWSDSAIVLTIPANAHSGALRVFTGPSLNASNFIYFTVEANPLPTGWLDQDVGIVGVTGSAAYANGTFTVTGAGQGLSSNPDAFHFVYLPLSGDGSIVARLVSVSGTTTYNTVVMIRETLNPRSVGAFLNYYPNTSYLNYRLSTNGSITNQSGSGPGVSAPPYWIKLVRSGNAISGYTSPDGMNWVQSGASVTVTMAQNAYIGLAVTSGSTTATATATFDNLEVNSAVSPLPAITSLSATTGSIGSQFIISGSNFGASQGSSFVTLNGTTMLVNAWSNTSIVVTVPAGATSGHLVVTIAPSLDDSNFVNFTVTPNPLPSGWLDTDIGVVGLIGSATYANGTFTVNGAGQGLSSNPDSFHFVYLPLSGDGSIVARLVSVSGTTTYNTVAMLRETLNPGSISAYINYYPNLSYLNYRLSTNGGTTNQAGNGPGVSAPPYWIKLVRSGNAISGYTSSDGMNWVQSGASVTVTMAQNAYIGLAVTSGSTTATATAIFDNLRVSSVATPAPVITSLSATTGSIGSQIVISGANFGTSQGSSLVTLNSFPMTVNSWSGTSITVTISAGAASGPILVSVGPGMNDSNYVNLTVTPNPLPSGWFDQDIGTTGVVGSASYASSVFTVSGGGAIQGSADAFHFAYQTLAGDGTIVARFLSPSGGGVMIRETLTAGSTHAYLMYYSYYASAYFSYRATTGSGSSTNRLNMSSPCWMKLTRTGTTFTGYVSPDGIYWTQVTQVTISMAQTIYIGLAAASGTAGTLGAVSFDNVTITPGTPTPTPVVTGITPTSGTIGTSVTVTGSAFGTTQGGSSVRFNGATASSVTSWSDSQVVAAVPSNASTGAVTVVVNSTGSNKNYVFSFYNPVINSVTPPAAEVGGYITLSGLGFGATQGSSQVQFNGVTASITSWSDTSVVVIVPTNATNGPVTLTEGGFTSNGVQFTVIEPVSASGISPATGPIGATVTITGAGFGSTQSNSVASFYGAPATITSWSDTSIVAVVPVGASTGPVSVQVAGITVWGPQFTLTSTLQVTDSLGNTSSYTSAIVGGSWVVTDSTGSGCTTCTQRGIIHKTYDSHGNVLSQTNELGHTTTYTYDSNGNVLSVSQPDGNGNTVTTSYTYNSFNEVLTVTDPLLNVTTNTYDTHGNLLTVTSPKPNSSTAASVTQFTYNTLGQMTQITDPLSHNTILTYTPAGLIATIKDAQNNITTYGYDTHGNRTSVTDALQHQTTFAYDPGDRLKTITYPDPGNTTTTFAYDYRGRRTSVTDQNGKTTTYAYDDADRLLTVTDAATNVTTYGYDTENNLTSIKDANNNTTSFTYDAFGRVKQTNFPSGYIETYNYDAVGNLTGKTDRKNQLISYAYDGLNRLTQKSYPDTTAVNYTYDLDSRLTQVTDPTGTYQFTFDNMGRLTAASTSYTFLTARNFSTGYSYDAASNRTGFSDPESGSTTYAYDTLNRLQTLTPPSAFSGTGSFGFSYDGLSRRTQMTRPNNVATNYAYDNLSRLQSVLHQLAGSTIDGATYTVDNVGNRTAKTDQRAGVTSNYGYDAIYELTNVTQATSTTESYTYDPVGNRLSSLGVSPYSVNTSNELNSTPTTSYIYDHNGNTTSKTDSTGTASYNWDFENRLISVTLPSTGGTVNFRYDPFGRRIQKAFSSAASPPAVTTTNYAYDGGNVIEEVDSNGTILARYAQTQNIDEPLAMLRGGTTSYYQADGLGSISSLSNTTGALGQTYSFDSFGKQTASSGSITNPFQYTAREFDSETGLYFYRARYYDPNGGRFISEDPLKSAVRLNRYKYVNNSPNILADPTGLQEQCTFNGTQQISPWIYSLTTTPDSGWNFLFSFAEGPGFPAGFITVVCNWERKITKEVWKSALFLLSWTCEETGPCGSTRKRIKYSLRRQREFVSITHGIRDPIATTFMGGPQDDEANDVECVLNNRPR